MNTPKARNAKDLRSRVDPDLFPTLYNSEGKVATIKKLSHRHLAIMDYMLANPTRTMAEVASEFRVTPAWLSTVRQSDLFRARLAERRKLMDEDQTDRITKKLLNVAEKGVNAISEIIEDEEQDGRLKLDATKTALESLGFLGKGKELAPAGQAQTPPQVNINVDVFQQAREMALSGSTARKPLELPNASDKGE